MKAFLALVVCSGAFAQSFSPVQPIDFSSTTTKPFQTGTALPGTCSVGQLFYKTNATAGQNLYGCTSSNTWTQQAGGGGGASLPATTNVFKGDNAGGAVAASPGTDYYLPGTVIRITDLPSNVPTTDGTNTFTDPGNQFLGKYDLACDATGVAVDNVEVKIAAGTACTALSTSDTGMDSGFVGVLISGHGTTSGRYRRIGIGSCTADNSISSGDWIVSGTGTGGYCKGSTARPASGFLIVGRATASATSGGLVSVNIQIDPNAGAPSPVHSLATASSGTSFIPGSFSGYTVLTWDTNVEDTGSIHSTSVNPSRFTAPSAGWYQSICQVEADDTNIGGAVMTVQIKQNGSGVVATAQATMSNFDTLAAPGVFHMAATDYVECYARNSSGAARNANAGQGFTFMSLTKLSN